MFTLFLCYFCRANVFALFMVLSRANMFTLFYVIFSQANVFALSVVLSRANVFSLCLRCLWYLHERICLRCLCYFSRANVFTLFMVLSRANMFIYVYFFLLVLFMLLARSGFTRSVFIFCLSCVWLNQIGVAALSVKIEALEKQVSADSVDRALVCVRQLAGRPVGLSDGTAIVAALESLADVSRSAGHVDFKRHEAILKQCRPLTHDPRLPAVVTQLLGDDESKKIAGQIQKILKSDHLFSAPQVHGSPFPAPARAPGYLRQQGSGRGRYTPYGYGSYNNNYASRGFNTTRCYNCRKTGHRITNCPALKRA